MKDPGAEPDLTLARQRRPTKDRLPKRARIEAESWQGVDRELFERLRELRLRIARARGVPPYVVFHDTTLREMARQRPRTLDALHTIYGLGERKIADYGQQCPGRDRRELRAHRSAVRVTVNPYSKTPR